MFISHRSAAIARKELQLDENNFMFTDIANGGSRIQVDWASPEPQIDPVQMARVTNLFVRNVSLNISEAELAQIFSLKGTVRVTRVRRPANYAFVHFDRREDAEVVKSRLQGTSLDGLTLDIEWAKPPPARGHRIDFENER